MGERGQAPKQYGNRQRGRTFRTLLAGIAYVINVPNPSKHLALFIVYVFCVYLYSSALIHEPSSKVCVRLILISIQGAVLLKWALAVPPRSPTEVGFRFQTGYHETRDCLGNLQDTIQLYSSQKVAGIF